MLLAGCTGRDDEEDDGTPVAAPLASMAPALPSCRVGGGRASVSSGEAATAAASAPAAASMVVVVVAGAGVVAGGASDRKLKLGTRTGEDEDGRAAGGPAAAARTAVLSASLASALDRSSRGGDAAIRSGSPSPCCPFPS